MSHFDGQLRQALRRVEPPAGLVERTLARAAGQAPARRPGRVWQYFGAIAASLALVVGGLQYQQYRRGQEAKEQLLMALEITGSQLTQVQNKVTSFGSEK
jgi:hypothetical protein